MALVPYVARQALTPVISRGVKRSLDLTSLALYGGDLVRSLNKRAKQSLIDDYGLMPELGRQQLRYDERQLKEIEDGVVRDRGSNGSVS